MAETGLDRHKRSARAAVMDEARAIAGEAPAPQLRAIVCPYCGTVTADSGRCSACAGRFDPLSRQATQNQMGPWSIRDDRLPFRPGCTYETIARLIEQGKISLETILRGPSTRQFWTLARHTPGASHLLGVCYSCQTPVKTDAFACPNCHASFSVERDRQHLGLGPSRPLPGQGLPEVLALRAEPAAQPGHTAASIASTPIGTQQPVGGYPQTHGNGNPPSSGSLELEEAARLARRWKAAFEAQRQRAWIVITISVILTLTALSYVLLTGLGEQPQTSSENGQTVQQPSP